MKESFSDVPSGRLISLCRQNANATSLDDYIGQSHLVGSTENL